MKSVTIINKIKRIRLRLVLFYPFYKLRLKLVRTILKVGRKKRVEVNVDKVTRFFVKAKAIVEMTFKFIFL